MRGPTRLGRVKGKSPLPRYLGHKVLVLHAAFLVPIAYDELDLGIRVLMILLAFVLATL